MKLFILSTHRAIANTIWRGGSGNLHLALLGECGKDKKTPKASKYILKVRSIHNSIVYFIDTVRGSP